jgi:hypothetical protein|tara:strand:+ start:242 stop:454 length:213 start_codon:yes stop_codon:yes gene_type:complete
MPIKYKEDSEVKDRTTGKVKVTRYYMHALPTPTLLEEFGRCSMPKIKVKFRNELVKRGFSNQDILSLQAS